MTDFLQYASNVLSAKELRQFKAGIDKPLGEFHLRVIEPQFYQANDRYYLGLAFDKYVAGRNPLAAEWMCKNPDAWSALTYFTNPLAIPPAPTILDDGREQWVPPMQRVVWGQRQVMTFEFDETDIAFFQTQMEWCRGRNGKPLDCPMGDLFRACSQWIDFEGITVAYSGNKSFHIHIVFDTSHAKAMGIKDGLRSGIKAHWHLLLDVVMQTLKPTVKPDMSMWEPERFRRIPNGHRLLDKPNVLLGIPTGEYVPQVAIWEKFRDRAAKGEQAIFFDPTLFVDRASARKVCLPKSRKAPTAMPSSGELDHCRAGMRDIFNQGYPQFHDFAEHDGSIRAHFFNHAGDANPASYMDAAYQTININGSNPLGLTPSTAPRLPKPLGAMIHDWCEEYDQISSRRRTQLETEFAEAVIDNQSARVETAKLLLRCIADERQSFVCAQEGITKTTGLFDNHQTIVSNLRARGSDGTVMYAFADYKSVAEKVEDFNRRQSHHGYVGIPWESFDRAYKTACERLSLTPLTQRDAMARGLSSLWKAVEALQPAVMGEFKRRHAEIWRQVGDAIPVFFTVHAVAHRWHQSTHSRTLWAKSFWTAASDERNAICRAETNLALLVHDEIKASDLVAAYRTEQVEWATSLFARDPKVWSGHSPASDRLASFDRYTAVTPPPSRIDFNDVLDIFDFHGHDWDEVTTLDSGEYGIIDNGAYADALGRKWSILERSWMQQAADRCIVLTTESVPLTIARRCERDWAIFDLDTPRIKKDVVETYPQRGVMGDKLGKICSNWQDDDSDLEVISNRVAHLAKTTTHAGARGSNQFIGKDVMQTMTFITPMEFELLEALNAWTETDTMIRQRHIDEFNQSAGRNLGFRKRGNARHYLVVNKALFGLLVGAPKARARYHMRVIANRYQREKAGRFHGEGSRCEAKARLAARKARLQRKRNNELRMLPQGFDHDWLDDVA